MPLPIDTGTSPVGATRPAIFGASFAGADVQATCFIPTGAGRASIRKTSFKRFGELQTITISSNRGVFPIRALGEHWVRDYVKGTRTFAGSLIFSVLERDVFGELYQVDKREGIHPYLPFVDQLPPFTIGLNAVNERGDAASMFIYGVTLSNFGQTFSIDDLFVETSYSYVAKWVTPFLPGHLLKNLDRLIDLVAEAPGVRASDLYQASYP